VCDDTLVLGGRNTDRTVATSSEQKEALDTQSEDPRR